MIAWQEMHQHHLAGNENAAHIMINELEDNWANRIDNNDVLLGRDIVQLLGSMNETVREVRRICDERMIEMRQMMENEVRNLRDDLRNSRIEITRLNNQVGIMVIQVMGLGLEPPPPAPLYTKEELCAEILEKVDESKETMSDQTYRNITEKLMEIYRR